MSVELGPAALPPSTRPARPASRDAAAERGWVVPLLVLVVGTFMSALDTSIVNVAVPRIQTDLSASPDDVEWVVTGFTLVLGMVVPLSGWLGDRLGPARLHMLAMAGFATASALCGLAWSLESLIFFRVLQAIPGGILPVVAMTIVFRLVPRDKIGAAMSIYGLGVVVAPASGPVLGGYLVEYVDWRLIFFINVPVGVLGTVAALRIFPRDRPTSWPEFDGWGFLTAAYGLVAVLLALSKGRSWGWDSYSIMILLVSGALSLALFVIIELEVDAPLIDMRVFTFRAYGTSAVLIVVAMTTMFSTLFFAPQFLQVVQGLQPLEAGLTLTPGAMVMLVMMPITGRVSDAVGVRWPAVLGLAAMSYGASRLASLTATTPRLELTIGVMIMNFGASLAMMPIMSSGLAALPGELISSGTGMNNVIRQAFSSVSVAVLGSLGASASAQMMSDRSGLVDTGAQASPQVAAMTEQGAPAMVGVYQTLRASVQTQTYDNGYFLVSILAAIGALIAVTIPARRTTPEVARAHVEV